ncbi:ATP-dependent DNA helicase RecG [Ornithinimicrobium pratense]|uniref:ATP-dependent DNA helicase RecG n=1 Tax=Ornithinimicrobium pratense TaxID=2593973 RepID=A0A5J6V6S2_9MICO|nr:ATP-dependent DNA helicase RecG [Ornithinimicrobium pratense]QFG68994.1 ATP-dependent DNA helicase RecG [Ornithinimicrobium pratense]
MVDLQPAGEADPRDRPLKQLVGKTADVLKRTRGLSTVGDLLDWLPRTYLDPARPEAFAGLPHGEDVVIVGTVRSARTHQMRNRRGRRLVVDVEDDTGATLQLTFFKPYGHEDRLRPGVRVVCSGQIGDYRGTLQLTHPDYAPIRDEGDSGKWLLGGLVPVYTATKGLSPIVHGDSLDIVLHALTWLPDPVPAHVRDQVGLPGLLEAYQLVHRPESEADHRRGRWRLKFQEAFVVQAQLARARRSADAVPATPRAPHPGGLVDALRERLPYTLTAGQEEVLADVLADLGHSSPMHRLLQGEVGSGKTVLALLAMLTVVDSGGQAALLAPTEVLAAQHHRSMLELLGPIAEGGMLGGMEGGTRVALLTGSQGAAERKANLLAAASGEAGIVVGTHALIQDKVSFAELGLVVVDEQHRFGVEQRDALRAKADGGAPHVLVMTATPIPRTVAMTVYGDMTTSTLRELPRGRQPITSHVVPGDAPAWVERTWRRVAEEVQAGGQVYVVCPRIGEPDDPDLPAAHDLGPGAPIAAASALPAPAAAAGAGTDAGVGSSTAAGASAASTDVGSDAQLHGVHQVARSLRSLAVTRDLVIAELHGRMVAEDKDGIMRAFGEGRIDVLVSTTVIEVGVDVPNATMMIVLDADRFGISQLHQLRGRVGRGGKPGLCLLVTQGEGVDPATLQRLQAVAATTDGFELARLDLETRREGDVLGASQSGGRSGLRLLRLARDEELIVQAHDLAWATVGADPELERHPDLAAELQRLDEERAAFLERG